MNRPNLKIAALSAAVLPLCVVSARGAEDNELARRQLLAQFQSAPIEATPTAADTNEVLVFVNSGVDAGGLAREYGAVATRSLQADSGAYVLTAATPQAADALAQRLEADPRVLLSGLNQRTDFARMSFVPNDPYFHHDTPAAGWPGEWHLINEYVSGRDAGVQGAWNRNITGSGVIIGIVDDSLQTTHPDLAPNYVAADSYDFGQNDSNPDPVNANDQHGISVAGVAAARGGNGIGVTGAAPYAGLAGLRIDFDNQTTSMFVNATLYHSSGANTNIKVENHSYGYTVPYITTTLEENAVATSAASGTIHCYAAGNNRGGTGQDANKLDLQNSPDVIAVAALGSDGKFAYYSNFGACVFVTAPSSSSGGLYGITTTDRVGTQGYNTQYDTFPDTSYTSAFGGTSSATPLVAGVMALAKQAQPKLNVRMAKHLLVKTSDIVDAGDSTSTSDGGWKTNAAGNKFNQNYGFGLIDAEEFALTATHYSGVTPLQTETVPTKNVNTTIPDNNTTGIFANFTLNSTTPLEDIQIRLSVSHIFRGDVQAKLQSPSGTVSRLTFPEYNDTSANINWTFLSNAFWGENPHGTWKLTLADVYSIGEGTWNSYSVTAHMGTLIDAIPGDTDYDGDVDLNDLGTLASNYGRTDDALWKFGDFDSDFDVDLSDLGALATHYAAGQAQAFADFQSLTGVPEPAMGVSALALIGLSFAVRRRTCNRVATAHWICVRFAGT